MRIPHTLLAAALLGASALAQALTLAPYSPEALAQAQAAGQPVALHFRADWCPTCRAQDKVLDTALAAGLDLPYACRGGVCCTCRARVLEGRVAMDKNFTLEQWEMDKGFVLTCQARPLTPKLRLSYDER